MLFPLPLWFSWWRCRESNPGPEKFNTNVYKLSRRQVSRPPPHPPTESAAGQPMAGPSPPLARGIGVGVPHSDVSVARSSPLGAGWRRTWPLYGGHCNSYAVLTQRAEARGRKVRW